MTLDLTAKVDGDTTGFDKAIDRAVNATNRYDAALKSLESDLMKLEKSMDDDIAAALDRQHQAMTKTGQAAFVFGAAVAAGIGMAANEAMKWESAWTGVTKTVDGSNAEMAQLETGLRQLAKTLPATHQEIAAVAEAAGQLGIKREAILGFTKTMIDLSETTNLTADEAATDMARFANIMQTPQGEIDRLGAALVALGNDGASTEKDILSMGMRIAGAGATIGLTEGEVMGLANALSSVGIEAEAGGSAISMVMKRIESQAVEGAGAVAQFADVAGMSAEKFHELWTNDPAAGLNAFIQGLGRIEGSGGSAIATLNELKFTQIRQSDALLRLANSGTLLADSLELGNQAWEENTALLVEAEKRYATTEARVQVAQNTMRDAAIDVGAVVLPALAAVADTVADLGAVWDDVPGPVKTAGVALGIAAAAIGIFGGAALMAIPKIAAFQTAVAGLEAGALKTAGTRLMGLGSTLMGPWGVALAAGATAMTIFAVKQGETKRAIDEAKAALDEQTGAIGENAEAWAIKELSDDGVLEAAKRLGLNLQDVTDAALGNEDAIARVNGVLSEFRTAQTGLGTTETTAKMKDFFGVISAGEADAYKVASALGATNDTLKAGQAQWQLEAEAKGMSTDASKGAAAAQKGVTAAWEGGTAAAAELGDEIKTLQDLFDALAGDYLNERQASRQVRDSLRDIRKAVHDYKEEHGGLKGAFKEGTKSGDEFQAMLDGLAEDYQNQVEATRRVSGSEKETMQVYRESRARLIEVADQLGMTKKEAKAYAEQVLGTPEMIRTFFDAATEGAEADVRRFRGLLDGLRGDVVQTFIRVTTLRNDIGESGGPNRGRQEANGGIVQTFASGGFTFDGRYVERVPQLRQGGGSIMWNEPETGWEAYVSGKPGMEARNREVWLEAGRRLGTLPGSSHDNLSGRSFAHSGGGGTRVIERVVEVRGRLDTPWGPAEFSNLVDDRIDAARSYDRVTGRRR